MMSNPIESDLIDFHVEGPSSSSEDSQVLPSTFNFDNLIDTDLPLFEQKLTQSNNTIINNNIRRNSVDVEDILINLDSDEFDKDSLDGDFLALCPSEEASNNNTLPADNFEALLVLKNLDDLLNATLEESTARNNNEDEDEDTQQIIEECLEDLDNYLQAIDSTTYDSESNLSDESNSSPSSEDLADKQESAQQLEFNEELARTKLRQIEENYRKFVASGIINRGYINTENNARPTFNRKQTLRATTTVTNRNRTRPRLIRRKSLTESYIAPTEGNCRTSGADATISDVISRERHAHASSDCCTGTVIVEPLRQEAVGTSSSVEVVDETRSPRLRRSSMRRLQQLILPPNNVETVQDNGARPLSAPSRLGAEEPSRSRSRNLIEGTNGRTRSSSASSQSRRRSFSSSSTSSSVDSTLSPPMEPSTAATANNNVEENAALPNSNSNGQRRSCDQQPTNTNEMPDAESPLGKWPHSFSSMLACLSCTLGLFNISRFAILAIHFGANFILQFIILTFVFGLPLFTLQSCLGQHLGSGVIDMWKISPLFQGVGVSLLITQALTGLYSIIGVSWMFVYFRDSFITAVDEYRWAEPFLYYRKGVQPSINGTYKLTETVPDYLNGVVLQRYHLPSGSAYGSIKFQSAFNLAVVWMIVFVSLSKGLRSYGKVIYVFTLVPIFGTSILCAKILSLMPSEYVSVVFPETSWEEFFLNSRSWLAAAQETFLTWGLLGAAIMQIASHNKHKHLLQRDSGLVAVITVSVLLLISFSANTCVHVLKSYGYNYYLSSFEQMSSYKFMRHIKDPLPPTILNTPIRYMRHNSFILGEKVMRPGGDNAYESGYQVLRFATELLPATFAVIGANQVSPFWAVLTYFIFIMFGIAQQLAIWHCVITGIMAIKARVLKKWESTITFFICAGGFILGLPMATELGIYVVYFMDYTLGSIWWLTIVVILQIMAVFLIRGRPYSGDTLVMVLFHPNSHSCFISWAPPLLSFTWNVILPVALMVLCIGTFKNGNFRDMFIWHHAPFSDYWPLWTRQLGSMLQLLPILCIPFVAVIQSYRYLNNGPSDILERIQLLYRPPIGEHMEAPPSVAANTSSNNLSTANIPPEDPPPKYTPPPSYTTATGARLAKFLRQSIRRSMRRIANVLGEGPSSSSSRTRPSIQQNNQPPPPDYDSVFVEMTDSNITTLERLRNLQSSPNALTAAEVASILRSSFRRSRVRSPTRSPDEQLVTSLSAEYLVDAVAPIGETSLVLEQLGDKTQNNGVSSVI